MTHKADLIHKMAEFFTSEEFFEKGEDARLELSPDDVRCMNEIIKACDNAISRQAVENITWETPSYTDALNALTEVREKVRQLPSVTPQEPQPDGDYILREKAKAAIRKAFPALEDRVDINSVLNGLQGFSLKPKTGHWITQDEGAHHPVECSECHKEPFCSDDGYVLSDYCPNCGSYNGGGAKMESEVTP